MKYVIVIASLLMIKCNNESSRTLSVPKGAKSIELFYLDSLNNYQSVKKIKSHDSISSIIQLMNNGETEYVKMNPNYNIKIYYKDTTYQILLNNEYAKHMGIVYKLEKNLENYILKQ